MWRGRTGHFATCSKNFGTYICWLNVWNAVCGAEAVYCVIYRMHGDPQRTLPNFLNTSCCILKVRSNNCTWFLLIGNKILFPFCRSSLAATKRIKWMFTAVYWHSVQGYNISGYKAVCVLNVRLESCEQFKARVVSESQWTMSYEKRLLAA